MADNPIKYSDFIQPDGSISDLIKQLEQVQTTYAKMRDEVVSAAKELEAMLKKVNNTTSDGQEITKKGAGEAEQLVKAYTGLTRSQTEASKTLADLKRQQAEQNNINKLTAKLNASAEGSYNRLSAQYSLNKIQLNQMSDAQRKSTKAGQDLEKQTKEIYEEMTRLQKATGMSQLQVGQYERGLIGVTKQFEMMPGPMGQVVTSFRTMTTAAMAFIRTPIGIVIAAFVAVGVAIKKLITTSYAFSAQMSRVKAVSGATADEMYYLTKTAKELGRATTKSAVQVGQLQEELAKLGFSAIEILEASAAIVSLSEAAQEDLAPSAVVAASTIRGLGLAATDTQRVVDVMAMSFNKSALDLSKFATGMAQVAPIARAAGVSLERATAMLGVLSDAGIDASMSGTSIRNMFTRLTERGITFEQALHRVNTAQDGMAESFDLFGQRGVVAGLILAKNREAVEEMTKALEDAGGAAKITADIMKDNLRGDTTALKNAWTGLFLAIESGDGAISKISRFFVQSVTKMVTALSEFSESTTGYLSAVYDQWNQLIEQSTAFRLIIASVESVFVFAIKNILSVSKIAVESMLGLGQVIKSVFTGDLDGAKAGWNKIKDGFINGTKEIIETTKGVSTTMNDAYSGESIDKYTIKSKEAVAALKKLSKEVKGLTEEERRALELSGELSEEAQDLLLEIQEEGQKKEIDLLQKKYEEKKKLFVAQGLGLVELEKWRGREELKIREKYAAKAKEAQDLLFETQEAGLKKELSRVQRDYEEKKKLFVKFGLDMRQLEDWRNREELAVREKYSDKAEEIQDSLFDIQAEGEQKELNNLQRDYETKKRFFKKHGLDLIQLEDWRNREELKIREKYLTKEEEDRQKAIDKQRADRKQVYDEKALVIDQEFELRQSEIDALKATEAEKTVLRLAAEKERLQKILALNKMGGAQLSAVQLQAIQNTIDAIDLETDKAKKADVDIYSMVGLKLDDEQKAGMEEATTFAIGQVQNFMQAKVDAAQVAVDAANAEVDSAKSKLDAEIEARNNGYASNVSMAQKEFELAKKNQEKALKEQEKARKAQAAIETLQQVGSLVTASAKIWGQLGFPWAIPALAIMWGSFAAAKMKAAQVTKKEYGEGGLEFLEGGSHDSGNDIPIGTTRDGKDRRAEGGEALAIIRKSQARRYKKILPGIINSLNKGVFEQRYMKAYDTGGMSFNVSSPTDLRALEGDVKEIKKQGERRYFVDGKGRVIETYKNLRRIHNAD